MVRDSEVEEVESFAYLCAKSTNVAKDGRGTADVKRRIESINQHIDDVAI